MVSGDAVVSIVHPVVCSPILTPIVDVLDPVAWRAGGAGQALAQRLAAQLSIDGGPYLPIMLSVDGGSYQYVIVEDE